jgi:hypothetical protein
MLMLRPLRPCWWSTALVGGLALGCGAAHESAPPTERARQTAAILEEAFRCELRQVVIGREAAERPVCLGARDADGLHDPPAETLAALGRLRAVRGASRCEADSITLIAGPIEWLSESEARVRGAHPRATAGSAELLYRVVWGAGRWECLGPISNYDPL